MFGNMKDMMGQLEQAKQQAAALKERLNNVQLKEEYQGVTVIITGNREIKDIQVAPELLQDREELQEITVLAVNKALEKAEELHQKEMESMIPGGLDFLK